MLYFTHELFCRLANQIHGQIHVMLELMFNHLGLYNEKRSTNLSQ